MRVVNENSFGVDAAMDDAHPLPAARALVMNYHAGSHERHGLPETRSHAAFIAHLIAMAHQVPQLRFKRRASAVEAAAAYRTEAPVRPQTWRRLRISRAI